MELGFALVSIAICFFALPQAYGWIVGRMGGPLTRAMTWHIFANCCANLIVLFSVWTRQARLDQKLSELASAVLASHGTLALVVVLTRSFYSNSIMLSAAVISLVLGAATILVQRRLKPPRVAVIGAREATLAQLPPLVERIDDPSADLRRFDLVLTDSADELPLDWTRAVARAMLAGKPVRHCAEYLEEARGLVSIDHFDIDQLPAGGIRSYQVVKRGLDLALAVVALPIAFPLLALGCLAVFVSMGRPLFFVQSRVGLGGRPFRMVKLRTMSSGAVRPSVEGRMAVSEGQRVTLAGGVLRRLRIDELPQLWHVLVGDMSFVGPRPEWTLLAERYAAQLPQYDYRHVVRPGLTGWAQVRSGYAGNLQETKLKVSYDLYYLKHLSLGLDLQILLRTVFVLITTRGAR
ncbi:MAG TPA: sugar transferase [Caulobacteraceae bacterium]|nr:sugar transferase [Caulobacteraceae bacterium]